MTKPSEPTIVIADINNVRYQIIHIQGSELVNIIGGVLDISLTFDECTQLNDAIRYLGSRHRDDVSKKMWSSN